MKAIKIVPFKNGKILVISIECDCGRCRLTDKSTGANSLDHPIKTGCFEEKELECKKCGTRYRISSDADSVRITQIKK